MAIFAHNFANFAKNDPVWICKNWPRTTNLQILHKKDKEWQFANCERMIWKDNVQTLQKLKNLQKNDLE